MKAQCNQEGIEKAEKIVSDGGVIVFPTDTVYGIGCNPYNKQAINRIYKIKKREIAKSLPILVYSKQIAEKIVKFDQDSKRIADKIWPGPLTLILKLTDEKLKETLNGIDKVAIRVPNHQCTLKLLKNCNFLIGTSANISNQNSYQNSEECYTNIQGIDLFLDGGDISSSGESTILELSEGKVKIHREGVLTKSDILGLL